jgi:hypothetical protein
LDLDRVWQPNSLWAQRAHRVKVPGTLQVVDTIDIILPLHDYRDGTEARQMVEGHIADSGSALAFKIPAVPLYCVDMVTELHNFVRNKSNDAFLTEHHCSATLLQDGKHYKWVKYLLPTGVVCSSERFNRHDGLLTPEFCMVPKKMPLKDAKGNEIGTFFPMVIFNVSIDGTTKMMERAEPPSVSQLTDAFNFLLGKI